MPTDPTAYGAVISRNVVAARARIRLKQSEVAARMRALGYSWHPQTVGEVEKGNRRLTAEEILGLALVLETSFIGLLEPVRDDDLITLPSGEPMPAVVIHELIWGGGGPAVSWDGGTPRFLVWSGEGPALFRDGGTPRFPARLVEPPRAARQASPAQQPIVAAIVTSGLGVLVGRRNDGTPPWTFIAGEVEPGEQAEDAAVREVKEETGLEVRAGRVIGERVHPKTGRTMIYMAAEPVRGTSVFVGDEAELAEVRWVGLAEADELLPGMYEPVREHLAATIGTGSGS